MQLNFPRIIGFVYWNIAFLTVRGKWEAVHWILMTNRLRHLISFLYCQTRRLSGYHVKNPTEIPVHVITDQSYFICIFFYKTASIYILIYFYNKNEIPVFRYMMSEHSEVTFHLQKGVVDSFHPQEYTHRPPDGCQEDAHGWCDKAAVSDSTDRYDSSGGSQISYFSLDRWISLERCK